MNIRTELLEALVRQCVREVLDQVEERVDGDGNPIDHSSDIGKKDNAKPKKIKAKWLPPSKFKVDIKKTAKINEEGQGQKDNAFEPDPSPSPDAKEEPSSKPEPRGDEPSGRGSENPSAEPSDKGDSPEPEKTELPKATVKGPVFVNPKDKSNLKPVRLQGRNDSEIERSLYQIAASVAGNKTKVSLGAKRMAREAAKNPSASIFFYLGKMDPESDEIFLMADKSLQVAKDDSVQPGDITGMPSQVPSGTSYTARAWDDPEPQSNPDNKYVGWMSRGKIAPTATPRYGGDDYDPQGLNENAKSMIKKMVNRILDGQK